MRAQKDELLTFLNVIQFNALMNQYALENIALGRLRPKDEIPYDRFVRDLELQDYEPFLYRNNVIGIAITDEEKVPDNDIGFFLKEYFISRMNFVFETASKKGFSYDEDGLYLFKNGLKDYIMRIFPLFREIMLSEVASDPFNFCRNFPDRQSETTCYEKMAKFIVAIKTRGLRQGGCVDRYVKELTYIPGYLKQLLKIQKNRYLLANSDPESIEYKLALLSSIQFMNPEHTQLFEMKMQKWTELHKK